MQHATAITLLPTHSIRSHTHTSISTHITSNHITTHHITTLSEDIIITQINDKIVEMMVFWTNKNKNTHTQHIQHHNSTQFQVAPHPLFSTGIFQTQSNSIPRTNTITQMYTNTQNITTTTTTTTNTNQQHHATTMVASMHPSQYQS